MVTDVGVDRLGRSASLRESSWLSYISSDVSGGVKGVVGHDRLAIIHNKPPVRRHILWAVQQRIG